jgi:hypothetical protein
MKKDTSELQRHQVSGTCSITVEEINAYTLPERHEGKKLLATHSHTQYNVKRDFNSPS